MDWHERKRERTKRYWDLWGRRLEDCVACNGSGHYDHGGSPKCGHCGGRGKSLSRTRSKPLPAAIAAPSSEAIK